MRSIDLLDTALDRVVEARPKGGAAAGVERAEPSGTIILAPNRNR